MFPPPSQTRGGLSRQVAGLAAAEHAAELGAPFYAAVGATAAHLLWQVNTTDLQNAADCGAKFRSNIAAGAVPFLGIVAGRLLY